jgi:uncharacterized repeat protein (TIGR03803 family)
MTTCIKKSLARPMLAAVLGSMIADPVWAQTFTTLYTFTASSGLGTQVTNSDGAFPTQLILSGNTLFGAAAGGGSGHSGTVFALGIDGSGFTVLHDFTASSPNSFGVYTNEEGTNPLGLLLSNGTLFGTAASGGISGKGTVFKINTDANDFTVVHDLAVGGGSYPSGLVLSGNVLYVRAQPLFKVHTDGTSFGVIDLPGADIVTSLLVSPDEVLYGAADGPSKFGPWLFGGKIVNDIPVFSDLYYGGSPTSAMILSSNTLYGAAGGYVFALKTDGSDFTNVHAFVETNTNSFGVYTNSEGAGPNSLILCGSTLYGTASEGGDWGQGSVFAVNTDGTGFVTLHAFTGGNDGANPGGNLVLFENTLYGTTAYGGSSGNGTIFRISLSPQLLLKRSASNLILSWPTNFTGYTLQHSADLGSTGWTAYNLQAPPVISNGQFLLTIPDTSTNAHQFFRLRQ